MKYTDDMPDRLHELNGSNFEIAKGQEDIIGWDVKDTQRNKIGKVDDLIFDKESLKVRYIILHIKKNKDIGLDNNRKVLIPIGTAELDKDHDDVILPNMTLNQLQSLPDYKKDMLNRDMETKAYNTVTGGAAAAAGNDFYNHEVFNDRNLYKNRRENQAEINRDREIRNDRDVDRNNDVRSDRDLNRDRDTRSDRDINRDLRSDRDRNNEIQTDRTIDRDREINRDRADREIDSDRVRNRNYTNGKDTDMNRDNRNEETTIPVINENMEIGKKEEETGGIRIRKRVVDEPVEEKVNLREEHVKVERKNVDRPATDRDFDNSKDQDIEMREHKEVPVVNKEARVVEEVRVKKEVTSHDETVKGSVRKTKVDVDELEPHHVDDDHHR